MATSCRAPRPTPQQIEMIAKRLRVKPDTVRRWLRNGLPNVWTMDQVAKLIPLDNQTAIYGARYAGTELERATAPVGTTRRRRGRTQPASGSVISRRAARL